jgi:serine/threonine protein kinase
MEELDLGQTVRGFRIGQKVFRRYALVRILGRGGMGVVWLARDEELERDVALKFLPDLVVHDLAVLDELKRETRRSLQLTHHNIVRIHDFVQDAESACISMEYVDGPTLSALRVEQPSRVFEPAVLLPWIEQICSALEYAHGRAKIVHRDIKPANLMLNGKGELKVADFGIARNLSDSVSLLTRSQGTSGTLVYMSPQQLNGHRASHLDDIYSLGASIYDLLTGRPPFYSGQIDWQIREQAPVSMVKRRFELEVEGAGIIPSAWEDAVASCLAKDPSRRPQRASELVARIAAKTAGPSSGATPLVARPSELSGPQSDLATQPSISTSPLTTLSGPGRRKAGIAVTFIITMLIASIAIFVRDRRKAIMSERETFATPQSSATLNVTAVPPLPVKTVPSLPLKQSPAAVSTPVPSSDSSAESPSDQRLTKFTHEKYGYTVLIPATVFPQPPDQPNDEHAVFTSTDGKTRMELTVEKAIPNRKLADGYKEWTSDRTKEHPHRVVAYKVLKSNWFVVSGDEDGRGFYLKCVERGQYFISMLLEYDEEACPIWQDTFTAMSRSFDGTRRP